jgi:WD40 repeat protein
MSVAALMIAWALLADLSPAAEPQAPPAPRGAGAGPLPGLLPRPAPRPGIRRWQLAHKTARGRINAIAWSPDGKRIAYNDGRYVRICDARDFRNAAFLVGHSGRITSLDWNRATNRLASSSADGTVRVWSAEGAPLHVLAASKSEVNAVAWSPDGRRLASAEAGGTLPIWDADGTARRVINVSEAPVNAVAWSADGTRLASGDSSQQLKIWNSDGTLAHAAEGHLAPVTAVAWSPDGKRLASASFGFYSDETLQYTADLRFWKSDGAPAASMIDNKSHYGIRWSPDSAMLAVLGDNGELRFVTPEGQERELRKVPGLGGIAVDPSLDWSADGKAFAFGGLRHLIVLDHQGGAARDSGAQSYVLPNYSFADWSPDGRHIALVTSAGVDLWTPDGRRARGLFDAPNAVRPFDGRGQAAWSPDGSELIVGGRGGALRWARVDGKTGKPSVEMPEGFSHVAWNAATGQRAFAKGDQLLLADREGTLGSPVKALGQIDSIRWSRDGSSLAVLSALKGERTRFAMQRLGSDGKVTATLNDLAGEVDAVDLSPDGMLVALGYDSGMWELWDLAKTNEPLRSERAVAASSCMDLSFAPDGKHFATAGWDGAVKLWRLDGTCERTCIGHTGPLYSVSFSPDGRRFVTAGWDQSLRVWNAETGREETIVFFADREISITIAADGRIVAGSRPAIESQFAFLIEGPSGRMEAVEYTEFLARTGQSP